MIYEIFGLETSLIFNFFTRSLIETRKGIVEKRKKHAGKHWVLTRKEKIMSQAEGYLIRHPLLGAEIRNSKPVPFWSGRV